MKKLILLIVLVLLVVAGIRLVKMRKQAVDDAPVAKPVTYAVRTVLPWENTKITQSRTFLARLDSVRSAGISSKLSGRINDLQVSESQRVEKGDLLLQIDDREIRASIAGLEAKRVSAEKNRRYAKKLLARDKALFKAGGLAGEKLEASEVAFSSAAAAVTEIEKNIAGLNNQLEYSQLRAPFDGIIGTVFFRSGDLATPGKTLLTLNSLPQKLTFSYIPETADIQPGQEVRQQGENQKLGTVTKLYNDARVGLWVAEVALDERTNQPAGSYLTIKVVTRTDTGCAVPVEALLHRQQGTGIMVYDQERFYEQIVTVSAQDGDLALIKPCVSLPVAVASEAKLSLLPTAGAIQIIAGDNHE